MNNSFSKKAALTFAWEKFKDNALLLVGAFVIIGVVSFILDATDKMELGVLLAFIVGLIGLVVQVMLEMGVTRIVLNIHAGHETGFYNLTSEMQLFFKYLFAQIVAMLAIMLGLVLFIVPGIIAALGLMFVPYIVIDKQLGPIEAVKDSWRLTKGHKWNLLLFVLAILLLNLVGLFAFMVGLLVTIPISFLATVYVYKWLDTHDAPVVQTAEVENE